MTSIPTNKLPKNLAVGSDVPDIHTYPEIGGNAADSELRKGQVLWLRGIARLQTQVNNQYFFVSLFTIIIIIILELIILFL